MRTHSHVRLHAHTHTHTHTCARPIPIRYSGATGCNPGWCSSAPGVHPTYHASRVARRCARGSASSFINCVCRSTCHSAEAEGSEVPCSSILKNAKFRTPNMYPETGEAMFYVLHSRHSWLLSLTLCWPGHEALHCTHTHTYSHTRPGPPPAPRHAGHPHPAREYKLVHDACAIIVFASSRRLIWYGCGCT